MASTSTATPSPPTPTPNPQPDPKTFMDALFGFVKQHGDTPPPSPQPSAPSVSADVQAAIVAERQRLLKLDETVAGLPGCDELLAKAKEEGWQPAQLAMEALKQVRTQAHDHLKAFVANAAQPITTHPATPTPSAQHQSIEAQWASETDAVKAEFGNDPNLYKSYHEGVQANRFKEFRPKAS